MKWASHHHKWIQHPKKWGHSKDTINWMLVGLVGCSLGGWPLVKAVECWFGWFGSLEPLNGPQLTPNQIMSGVVYHPPQLI
mmetsp:Transcript_28679/g.51450  ORF Transcript_28679/g.51450 Transcript_28679/m.51450 type:complete len:81 (-) Transcript_28679:490-732(-)